MNEPQKLKIIGVTNPSRLACIARARTYTQYRKMVDDALADRCPFCNIDTDHNKIVAETAHWVALHCNPPEKHTKHHFLYVPRSHVVHMLALLPEELANLFTLISRVRSQYSYRSSGILIRDGDATLSAGTIQHLHVHEMVPDGTGRVESPFYKGREAEEASLRRAIIFEKMRKTSILTGLTDPFLLASNLSEEDYLLIDDRLK